MTGIGILYGVTSFTLFGVMPVYYKFLSTVPAFQIALQRFTWTLPWTFMLLLALRQHKIFAREAFTKANLALYSITAGLVAASTLLVIWAVNSGYLLEVSLGAFLNPITIVTFGVVVLKEKLRLWQVVAVACAAIGVGIFAIAYGKFPWVAMLLTTIDGSYSYVKKKAPLTPLHGMVLESLLMFPVGVVGVVVLEAQGASVLGHVSTQTDVLLIGTGIFANLPLVFLVAATQLAPLYVIGLIANLAPTIQFFFGVFVYNEPFTTTTLVGFCFLWLSMGVFAVDSFRDYKKSLLPSSASQDGAVLVVVVASPHKDTDDNSFTGVDYEAAKHP
ncbi:hypothetical protein DYB25_005383 [Aphanomyces astaci]|uniref:EamA domain-containing protein n=1 Tax=Aphanomyces astaci TaxID=112090 RepID=A0A397A2C2_APHAT|nr:hypothetical protein DYB25_005383 [Aphanomyces astaci]RHY02013.1 hypothetical protein DYB36_011565 [Aphanomyces astaci]RHY36467.1 hypothetical protein DYB34_011200 [Aphanomyces astaci]RHY57692.1 hypothetical protein DYB38_007441 [Aphanomyces astaci]RQM31340.1 hypothetical protein B5M09_013765 [Aphanomyces astaci]